MIRLGLECLLIFNSIFGLYSAENGIHRVNRQDFNSGAFSAPAASYQQPFESKNGIYRVQRQDFTNTNDVPFSDSYQSPYVNRFSRLHYESGNVNRSYTPLPKLFLPAAPRLENPYLSIGLPNYDRVVPASSFGIEFHARTSAPTRVTLRPQITIHDVKRYNDEALPAIPNSQDDSPLPSISEYSKSSPFDEDFSSMVEQFEMTEDRKSICKGADCRRSSNDDADAVKPIRRRRSLDYDPYYSYSRILGLGNYYRKPYWQASGNPLLYDHEDNYDYSYLNSLSKNRISIHESPSNSNSEEFETPSSTDFARSEESTSTDNNYGSVEEKSKVFSWSWNHETTSEPERSGVINFDALKLPKTHNYDPLLDIDFEALVKKAVDESEQETTTSYDFNNDDNFYSTETPLESTNSNQDEAVTPIECFFQPETTESQTDSGSLTTFQPESSDFNFEDFELPSKDKEDSLLSIDFEALIKKTEEISATSNDDTSYSTETPMESANSNPTESQSDFDSMPSTTIPEDNSDVTFYSAESTTNSDDNSDVTSYSAESTTNSDDNSDITSDPTKITTNSEVTTDSVSSEPKYFDVDGESLTPEQKFVILFVCSMWPELYKKPILDSNDPETRNLYQLCNFLNSIDDHIVVDVPSKPKTGCDEDESEATTEEPKSDANELFKNYFLRIIEEKNDLGTEAKPAEFDGRGEEADSASTSFRDIPVVLTLFDNISK